MSTTQQSPSVAKPEIVVDAERWPLVNVRFIGDYSDEQFDKYLVDMTRVISRAGRRVLIYDASRCGDVRASHRKKQAEWMKQHQDNIKVNTAGIAFVLPSALLRGALTAILWIKPLDAPHVICATAAEAERRAQEWLQGASR